MKPFEYARAATVADALDRAGPDTEFLAGGTELVPWLADGIIAPRHLVDVSRFDLGAIEWADGRLRIGAMARLEDVARHPLVRAEAPALAESTAAAASAAIRSVATLGGNLLQKTRCAYFRRPGPCNRREPDSGCGARTGDSRGAALLGGSDVCVAVHASDPAVALVALDAIAIVESRAGRREIAVEALYPEVARADRDHLLDPAALIVAIEIPVSPLTRSGRYLKVRDRAAFDFAVASLAVHWLEREGTITDLTLALGGIATRPWRCRAAEGALRGRPLNEANVRAAMAAELAAATATPANRFKIELANRLAIAILLDGAVP